MTTTTIEPDEIGRQIDYRMSQASYQHAVVPTWLDPVPDTIAEAIRERDDIWSRLVDLEHEAQRALGAIDKADASDAQAIRDAARAGKPLPKTVDRDKLRRELAYAYERVLPVFAEHSQANSRVREAIDAAHKTLVTAAVAEATARGAEYKRKLEEARNLAAEAEDEYARAQSALNWVSNLKPVRDNVQFTAAGDGAIRVSSDNMAGAYLANTCAMLKSRGLVNEEIPA
jgi:hypothetical protein